MIKVILHEENSCNLKIVAQNVEEFNHDLDRIKKIFYPQDRTYSEFTKLWTVKNLHKYIEIPFIKAALEDKERQPSLF